MTKLEEIARAIHDSFYNDEDSGAWMSGKCPLESVTIDGDVDMIQAARAVLFALKTPTPGMIEAGFMARERGMTMAESAEATFRAMIDAAEGG